MWFMAGEMKGTTSGDLYVTVVGRRMTRVDAITMLLYVLLGCYNFLTHSCNAKRDIKVLFFHWVLLHRGSVPI